MPRLRLSWIFWPQLVARASLLASATLALACFDDAGDGGGAEDGSDSDAGSGTDDGGSGPGDTSTSETTGPGSTGSHGSAPDTSGPGTTGETTSEPETSAPDTSGPSTSGGETSGGGTTGDAAPFVVEVTPETGATGVFRDVVIAVTFSEAMATADTEAAYSSPHIGPVGFSWSNANTVLNIHPGIELDYATGSDPAAVDAIEYSFTIAASATDYGGTSMESAFESNFFTLRQISQTIEHDETLSGAVVSNGTLQTGAGGDPVVGDHDDNLQRKGFFGFHIEELPDGIAAFPDAEISATQWLTLSTPFADLGGEITMDHIEAAALDLNAFNVAPLATLGVFSASGADGERTMDVSAAVSDDYENGRSFSQFRLQFSTATDSDGVTDRTRYHFEALDLTYLVP